MELKPRSLLRPEPWPLPLAATHAGRGRRNLLGFPFVRAGKALGFSFAGKRLWWFPEKVGNKTQTRDFWLVMGDTGWGGGGGQTGKASFSNIEAIALRFSLLRVSLSAHESACLVGPTARAIVPPRERCAWLSPGWRDGQPIPPLLSSPGVRGFLAAGVGVGGGDSELGRLETGAWEPLVRRGRAGVRLLGDPAQSSRRKVAPWQPRPATRPSTQVPLHCIYVSLYCFFPLLLLSHSGGGKGYNIFIFIIPKSV